MPASEDFVLPDGRALRVHRTEGRPDRTVVLCHPSPGSGAFDPDPRQTAARDVTLLAPDRAGYGGSSPLPAGDWATVARSADDLAHVLDELQTGPVGVAGWSAGGRVALALAARRPDLVDRLVVSATPMPEESGLPPEVLTLLDGLEGATPAEAVQALTPALTPFTVGSGPLAPLELLGGTQTDEGLLASVPQAPERLAQMFTAAFAQGSAGFVAEVAATALQPWGFAPEEVRAKTLLTYGSRDPVAANRHAQSWHRALPQSRVEMAPGAGPLALLGLWKRALSHLTPQR